LKISEIIESIINENIAYKMALENEIVNYTALAKKIKPKVESLSGKEVPLNTIVKILTLYNKKSDYLMDPFQALKQVSISLEYGFSKKTVSYDEIFEYQFTIAVKNGDMVDILYKDDKNSELALLRLKMKENFSEVPGITVLIISILELFEIKIKYIYRLGHEILILLSEKDGPKALEKLAFYLSIQK